MRLAVLSTNAVLYGLGIAQSIPTYIIDILTDLTATCEGLLGPASQLSVLNAPLMLIGAGPWPVRHLPCVPTSLETGTN